MKLLIEAMKPATRSEAMVLATMARGGTLSRVPSDIKKRTYRLPWELRAQGGGVVPFPMEFRRPHLKKEGDAPVWWAKKLIPLVERGLLIGDHPILERATRIYITEEGQAIAWRLTRRGYYGAPIPCLICDREPHGAADCGHEYQPATKWAKEIRC